MEGPQPSQYEFDTAVFRLSAVKKAAYRFSGDFVVHIEVISDRMVRVRLAPRAERGATRAADQYPAEVLDQELREQIADETAGIRDVLLAHTFSEIPLTDIVGESVDFQEDPLNISQSHFEKRGSGSEP